MICELFFPGWSYQRTLQRALRDSGLAPDQAAILKELWSCYRRVRRDIPRTYPLQSRLLLTLAARNVALDRVMTGRGASRLLIDGLLGAVNRRQARGLGAPLRALSRVAWSRGEARLRFIDALLYRWLFVAPFRRTVLAPAPGLAFDITACPLARFYCDQGAAHVCRAAACDLDHDFARAWRVGFSRTATIAGGSDRCDFRFSAGP